MKEIGFIGLGKMGSRMALRLLRAGNRLYVNDTVKAAAEPLMAEGAVFAEKPCDLCGHADYIFLSIPNAAALKEVVCGEKGILEKAIPPRQLTRVCPSAITRQSPRLRQNLTR